MISFPSLNFPVQSGITSHPEFLSDLALEWGAELSVLQASGETQRSSIQPADCKRTCGGVCSECWVITAHTEPQLPNSPRAGAGAFIPGKWLLQRLCPRFNNGFEVSWTSCCSRWRQASVVLSGLFLGKLRVVLTAGYGLYEIIFFPSVLTTQSCPSPRCCLPISWLTGGRKAPWQLATPKPPSPDLLSPKPAADVGQARALLPIRASHAEIPALFAWHWGEQGWGEWGHAIKKEFKKMGNGFHLGR